MVKKSVSLCNTNKFVLLMETANVYCEVGTEFVFAYYMKFITQSTNC